MISTERADAAHICLTCMLTFAALCAIVAGSFAFLALDVSHLFSAESAREMEHFFLSFFPPDFSPVFLTKTGYAALETLAISAVGTLLAVAFGLLLALPASGRYGIGARAATRFILSLVRSVPELVWAALMVLAAGLGPFAGTLALAAHTSGVLGRLFADALENTPEAPAQALADAGASPALAFLYGTLPGVLPQIIAYSFYRWEMNIRMAAILGFVGAGGLGQMLYFELSLFHEAQAATVIIAMLLLAMTVDSASGWVRRHFAQS